MINLLTLLLSTVATMFIIVQAIRLDRKLPWFERLVPPSESAPPHSPGDSAGPDYSQRRTAKRGRRRKPHQKDHKQHARPSGRKVV